MFFLSFFSLDPTIWLKKKKKTFCSFSRNNCVNTELQWLPGNKRAFFKDSIHTYVQSRCWLCTYLVNNRMYKVTSMCTTFCCSSCRGLLGRFADIKMEIRLVAATFSEHRSSAPEQSIEPQNA